MVDPREFGSGLRERLARQEQEPSPGSRAGGQRVGAVDLRPFYELLRSQALVFSDFKPTAPHPRRTRLARLR